MNNKALTNAMKANFLKQSPDKLTEKVMTEIAADKSATNLLPKPLLYVGGILSFLLIVSILYFADENLSPISTETLIGLWQNNLSLFVLPLCIISLMFIQSLWLKKRMA